MTTATEQKVEEVEKDIDGNNSRIYCYVNLDKSVANLLFGNSFIRYLSTFKSGPNQILDNTVLI